MFRRLQVVFFIQRALQKNPTQRATIRELLFHPFIATHVARARGWGPDHTLSDPLTPPPRPHSPLPIQQHYADHPPPYGIRCGMDLNEAHLGEHSRLHTKTAGPGPGKRYKRERRRGDLHVFDVVGEARAQLLAKHQRRYNQWDTNVFIRMYEHLVADRNHGSQAGVTRGEPGHDHDHTNIHRTDHDRTVANPALTSTLVTTTKGSRICRPHRPWWRCFVGSVVAPSRDEGGPTIPPGMARHLDPPSESTILIPSTAEVGDVYQLVLTLESTTGLEGLNDDVVLRLRA
jgi:hypothetical protein